MSPFEVVHTIMHRDPWGTLVLSVVIWWVYLEIVGERH